MYNDISKNKISDIYFDIIDFSQHYIIISLKNLKKLLDILN